MGKPDVFKRPFLFILLIVPLFSAVNLFSQPVVGLDNWYNHETDVKTGKPFHYLWTDTEPGGYSGWGGLFTRKGATITTIGKPSAAVLSKLDIYIIVDPDTTTDSPSPNYIKHEDIALIKRWVEDGGVLVVMANDGPNCEFTHLNELMIQFGMTFNHVTLHTVTDNNFEMGACTNLPAHSLFKGVTKIFLKEISDISLSGTAKSILTEKGKVLMAENRFGKGYVFAVGDPWIYNEYIDHDRLPDSFENLKAAENLTDLLLNYTRKK